MRHRPHFQNPHQPAGTQAPARPGGIGLSGIRRPGFNGRRAQRSVPRRVPVGVEPHQQSQKRKKKVTRHSCRE